MVLSDVFTKLPPHCAAKWQYLMGRGREDNKWLMVCVEVCLFLSVKKWIYGHFWSLLYNNINMI